VIDVEEPGGGFSAARYVELAEEAIAGIRARGRVPIVTAGTGLYLRALLRGLFPGPARDEPLREVLRGLGGRLGWGELHRWLRRLDPAAAARVPPADKVRIVRALEVAFRTGRPFSAQAVEWGRCEERHETVKFGLLLPRRELHRRIDARAEGMLRAGLLEEARRLREQGVPEDASAFRAIGYREALRFLRGEWNEARVLEEIQKATRRYAKRQMTWFKREKGVRWMEALRPLAQLVQEIARTYEAHVPGGTGNGDRAR
jgi:tRNA dimethylallyltransferase